MINEKKGHIFFWHSQNFKPLRTFIAFVITIITYLVAFLYLPIPFADFAKERHEQKTQRIINSQNLKPIPVISAEQLGQSGFESHFSHYDPVNLNSQITEHVESRVNETYQELIQQLVSETPYQITYAEIPVSLPTPIERVAPIPAITPFRPVQTSSITAPPVQPVELSASFHPSDPTYLPPTPQNIKHTFSKVTFHISTTREGEVNLLLPYDPDFKNTEIESWIRKIKFPVSTKTESYQIILKLEPRETSKKID